MGSEAGGKSAAIAYTLIKTAKMNNGHYILFLAQRLSKLNRYSKMLDNGPYYKNWSKSYLKEVKGFRDPAKTRS